MTIYNFSLLNVPFANNAQSNEIDAFPDFNRGLGIAFDQTDGKPEMKGLNGLFQQITTSIVYLKQRGIAEWDAELEYPIGAFVVLNGFLYKATTVNTGKNPTTSQNSWQAWATVSDITVSTNGNLKKTSGNNGSISLEVPTASDTQRGAVRFATATEVANKLNVSAAVTPSNVSTIAQSSDIGVGQTWQNVTSSRSKTGTYFNDTGKPIVVNITILDSGQVVPIIAYVSGVMVVNVGDMGSYDLPISFIVPNGSSYSLNIGSNNIKYWAELR